MQKRYEASYSGYVYEKPKTHWSSEADVKSSLRKVDFTQREKSKQAVCRLFLMEKQLM